MARGNRVVHEAIHCENADTAYSLEIPTICYSLKVSVRHATNTARAFVKWNPKDESTYANEVADDSDYYTISQDNPLNLTDIRFLDKHLLWVSSGTADTYIEVVYTTGY